MLPVHVWFSFGGSEILPDFATTALLDLCVHTTRTTVGGKHVTNGLVPSDGGCLLAKRYMPAATIKRMLTYLLCGR